MNPPHGDLVLSRVSIRASPNLAILGVKFDRKLTFVDHVSGIVSRVSQRIGILRLVKRLFVDTCVNSLLLYICSSNPRVLIFGVGGPVLNVTICISSDRCYR